MPQAGINFQNELSQVIRQYKKQGYCRMKTAAVAAHAQQHRPNINIRYLEQKLQAQAQLVQLGNIAQQT